MVVVERSVEFGATSVRDRQGPGKLAVKCEAYSDTLLLEWTDHRADHYIDAENRCRLLEDIINAMLVQPDVRVTALLAETD